MNVHGMSFCCVYNIDLSDGMDNYEINNLLSNNHFFSPIEVKVKYRYLKYEF